MTNQPKIKIILGNVISPVSDKKSIYRPNSALILSRKTSGDYKILKWCSDKEAMSFAAGKKSIEVLDYSNKLITPSFCDLHFHWVQDDVREMPKDNLLDWLKNHTWPTEKKYGAKRYCQKRAKEFSQKLFTAGTLSGGCYSSIHSSATEIALSHFPEGVKVGNVQMTMNSPNYLMMSQEKTIKECEELIKKYKNRYAVTPRFAITTHPEVMKQTALIGKRNNSFIQTHLSETPQEVEAVMDIYSQMKGFEKVKSYTEVYERSKILGPKTIMGHGIYLSNEELKLIKKTQTIIAHCPTSNAPLKEKGLGSGLMNLEKIEKNKIRWALGSDIGAGPYLSMIDVMNSFVRQHKKSGLANYTKAFYRSTLAGEEMLLRNKKNGSFEEGKDANFLVLSAPNKIKNNSSAEEILKMVFYRSLKNRDQVEELVEATFFKGVNRLS